MEDLFGNSQPMSRYEDNLLNSGMLKQGNKLTIKKTKTHSEEKISKNGISKNVLVVIKNQNFSFDIEGSIGTKIDFSQISFDAKLVYENENEKNLDFKEVDYVKVKPIDFKPTAIKNGSSLECELKIKVLSSQHEDMFFKIKIQGSNPTTKQEIENLYVYSPPIKVISKPEKRKANSISESTSQTTSISKKKIYQRIAS